MRATNTKAYVSMCARNKHARAKACGNILAAFHGWHRFTSECRRASYRRARCRRACVTASESMLRIASFRAKATRLGPLPIDRVAEHMIVDHGGHLDSRAFEKVRGVMRLKSMQK